MSLVHSHQAPTAATVGAPELPPGWRHTDDAEREFRYLQAHRRRRLLVVGAAALAVAVLVVAAGLLLLDARGHYARGMEALEAGSYVQAGAELAQANVLGVPYRDAPVLAAQARRELTVRTAAQEAAAQRAAAVDAALAAASAALAERSAPQVLAALESVTTKDLAAVLAGDAAARGAAAALAERLAASADAALHRRTWGKAAQWAAALVALDPSSQQAASLSDAVKAGQKLTDKFAAAQAAARKREWRKALDLALAVQAADKGFPGAAGLVADARKALRPKPQPAPTAAATTPATTTGGTTTGGSSSGGSSQPPPP